MLGRIALGAFCECCNSNRDTRTSKRRERRLTEVELAEDLAELEREDPAVADAARRLDEVCERIMWRPRPCPLPDCDRYDGHLPPCYRY